MAGLGLWSLRVYSQRDLLVGYAAIEREADSTLPVSTALFAFRNSQGILVAEAGVEAVEPILRGRIFVDGSVPTGLALANPSNNSVVFQGTLTSLGGIVTGYAVVTVEEGGGIPSGTAIFQFRDALGNLVSEAGVGAVLPTTRARIFVDTVNTRTGVAIASVGNGPTEVTLRLLDRNGLEFAQTTRDLDANGHLAIFVDELFEDLPPGFTGILEIQAEVALVPITLKLTINARGDLILTTLPVADLTRPMQAESLVFPQIGFGQGFSTRLILISSSEQNASNTGLLTLTQSDGTPLTIPLLGVTDSQFDYQVLAAGARQLRPGNTAVPVQLILDASDPNIGEVVVNEGNRRVLRPLVIDTAGEIRDDFPSEFINLDEQTAQVAATGEIGGMEAGFSTLVLKVGPLVATTTITVVRVTQGAAGFSTSGISQDLSGRFYLASPTRQQILLTNNLTEVPEVYAGIEQSSGLVNDLKLQSLFDDPRSMALNQADGSLFVADRANHVIRKIPLAEQASVQTLAGNGQAGSRDGAGILARFRSPSGVALDARGGLWVSDTGNHSIRPIDLATQEVTTIAGVPGEAGLRDGQGSGARFDSPEGIAIQRESIAQQLQREFTGKPPPPTRVVVADRGNRAIRIVSEDGMVETLVLRRRESPLARIRRPQGNSGTGLTDPRGIAADPFGNLYVSEGEGQVTTILANGETVSAAQSGTFDDPQDVEVTQTGRVIVADSESTGRELVYGTPEILSVTPSATIVNVPVEVAVQGRNFAGDSFVVIGGVIPDDTRIVDTSTIRFTLPALSSGLKTLTLQHRGGIAQAAFAIDPIPLDQLEIGEVTTIVVGSEFDGDGGLAVNAELNVPLRITLDLSGNLFIADFENHRIRRVDATTGIITTVAGTGLGGAPMEGERAITAQIFRPPQVAFDRVGNFYFASNEFVRRVDIASGLISTITNADAANGLSHDGRGNLYISETFTSPGNRVIRYSLETGERTVVAGMDDQSGFAGDGGPVAEALIFRPWAVDFDSQGNIYILGEESRVRKVDAQTGIIDTVAGGRFGGSADDIPALEASLDSRLFDISFDANDNMFITDGSRIRRIDAQTALISTVAGCIVEESACSEDENVPATEALLNLPFGVEVDGAGNLFITDTGNNRVRRVDAETGLISTIVAQVDRRKGDGGPATQASLFAPREIAFADDGDMYFTESEAHLLRRVEAETGEITTVAGGTSERVPADFDVATDVDLFGAWGLAIGGEENIYVTAYNTVFRIDVVSGTIERIAGEIGGGFAGDGGPAIAALLARPQGLALDGALLYVADSNNHRVRMIDLDTGLITTAAGTGSGVLTGEGPALTAGFAYPVGLSLTPNGDLLIASSSSPETGERTDRILRLDRVSGMLTVVAGNGDIQVCGDGGPATEACLESPQQALEDPDGNIFISDGEHHRIRMIAAGSGIITTILGGVFCGPSGDGGPGVDASIFNPTGLALDSAGNLIIASADDQATCDISNRLRALRLK